MNKYVLLFISMQASKEGSDPIGRRKETPNYASKQEKSQRKKKGAQRHYITRARHARSPELPKSAQLLPQTVILSLNEIVLLNPRSPLPRILLSDTELTARSSSCACTATSELVRAAQTPLR